MPDRPVLILGAGINGAALARELALNRVPVVVIDTGDIAGGTTAYSSRLIHGGLRYLEYGEFDLVRESLDERNRLLQLAPDFVRPLRLFIPVTNRFGGWSTQAARFLGLPGGTTPSKGRGLYVVRAGLWMYDRYARDDLLPRQSLHRPGDPDGVPLVTSPEVRWLCAYSDAQIPYAERFVVALLQDAQEIAKQKKTAFAVHTYCEAVRFGDEIGIRPIGPARGAGEFAATVTPWAIVNATGAWVDDTLHRLKVPSDQLIGGTKGSHFVTFHARLRTALRGGGIYTEAADGRPIFILPLGEGVLIGTTDIPFAGDPASAVATDVELDYLVAAVQHIFPDLGVTRDDIALHYSGVRPLPKVAAGMPAGITRRHLWRWHRESKVPMLSLIGGKLTTCRAFAEQTVAELMPKLGRKVEATSRDRPVGVPALAGANEDRRKPGLQLSPEAVRRAIRQQWARTLGDLVERRLMLLFEPQLSLGTLQSLAEVLVEEKQLAASDVPHEIEHYRQRLAQHFGRRLA